MVRNDQEADNIEALYMPWNDRHKAHDMVAARSVLSITKEDSLSAKDVVLATWQTLNRWTVNECLRPSVTFFVSFAADGAHARDLPCARDGKRYLPQKATFGTIA